jgi:hypothetical protein
MKETRAVVTGLVFVLVVALIWGFFRRSTPHMRKVHSFRVQIDGDRDGRHNHVSVRIPGFLVAKVSSLASHALEDSEFTDWNFDGENGRTRVTPKDILDAADKSEPDKPSIISLHGGDDRLEVSKESDRIRIVIFDRARRDVEIVAPRAFVERLAQEEPLSVRSLFRRIDDIGPGDLVTVTSEDATIKVTAEK